MSPDNRSSNRGKPKSIDQIAPALSSFQEAAHTQEAGEWDGEQVRETLARPRRTVLLHGAQSSIRGILAIMFVAACWFAVLRISSGLACITASVPVLFFVAIFSRSAWPLVLLPLTVSLGLVISIRFSLQFDSMVTVLAVLAACIASVACGVLDGTRYLYRSAAKRRHVAFTMIALGALAGTTASLMVVGPLWLTRSIVFERMPFNLFAFPALGFALGVGVAVPLILVGEILLAKDARNRRRQNAGDNAV